MATRKIDESLILVKDEQPKTDAQSTGDAKPATSQPQKEVPPPMSKVVQNGYSTLVENNNSPVPSTVFNQSVEDELESRIIEASSDSSSHTVSVASRTVEPPRTVGPIER